MADAHAWVERLRGATIPTAVALPRCPGLTPDERIIVAAIRLMVVDGLEAASAGVAIALKPGGSAVLGALQDWLGLLARKAARHIAVGAPQHCCASPDELAMLVFVEAARRGDFTLAHRMIGQFVAPGDIDELAHASEIFAARLDTAGFKLASRRLSERPQPGAR